MALFAPLQMSAEESQSPLKMDELTIQVLPEFAYHPEDEKKEELPVLTGYHGTLENVTDKPQKEKINIALPVGSKNLKVGYIAEYNEKLTDRYDLDYELDEEKGIISWEMGRELAPGERYKFVIEFYTNDLIVNENEREMSYTFEMFTDIGLVNLIFLEPLKAEDFKLTPGPDTHQQNPYGMNMFHFQMNNLEKGEQKTVEIAYKRDETRMTSELFDEMYENVNEVKTNETMPRGVVIAGIGGISVVAIALLVLFLRKKKPAAKEINKNKKGSKQPQQAEQKNREMKMARLRAMLVDGKITEEEYKELLKKLGG